jgi:sugar phosphate permease
MFAPGIIALAIALLLLLVIKDDPETAGAKCMHPLWMHAWVGRWIYG